MIDEENLGCCWSARNRDKRRQIPPLRRTRSLEVGRRMQEIGTWFVSARMGGDAYGETSGSLFQLVQCEKFNATSLWSVEKRRRRERIFVNEEIVWSQRNVIMSNLLCSLPLFQIKWNFSLEKLIQLCSIIN